MTEQTWIQFGQNAGLMAELYSLYQRDPSLVGETWATFFRSFDSGDGRAAQSAANSSANVAGGLPDTKTGFNGANGRHAAAVAPDKISREQSAIAPLQSGALAATFVDAFRRYGHLAARINPLTQGVSSPPPPRELNADFYGIAPELLAVEGVQAQFAGQNFSSLGSLQLALGNVYCGSVGFEYMHVLSSEERAWLQSRIEATFPDKKVADNDRRRRALGKLIAGELFESELHRKYVGTKRFSLEGGEVLIPMLDVLLSRAARSGVEEAIFGMAHRGRLNVLTNILGKPFEMVFGEFEDQSLATVLGSGDVKYHLGFESDWSNDVGDTLRVRMAPNPSHLEFVNPVVEGIARALQERHESKSRKRVVPVLLHGDAAFAGQGVVFETINYSRLDGYSTGGTVHIIINNQIGFTTTPDEARSTVYCTDLAKGIDSPVFHVNCDDVDACCWISELALDYRNAFGKDVFIDLYCYRKYGHNEGDDPSFTQPLTYAEIKSKKLPYQMYSETLIAGGVLSRADVDTEIERFKKAFADAQDRKDPGIHGEACSMHGRLRIPTPDTGVSEEVLKQVAKTLVTYPDGFVAHPKLQKILEKRVETVQNGSGIEWGMAEALAFGSIVLEGRSVRLSGQDCGRGTFSQRHLLLDHYEAPATFIPFSRLSADGKSKFEVFNSSLSEIAVVGFEFGYSSIATEDLVLWEAQFGDFGNGAQVIIDQFLASSEAKWNQLSGVTLLLPHGYEGQGPEHSSARLERYLQLCGEGNMVVCYPSTAAQHFHLMRRQALLEIKRPLIVITPKSMLRLPAASANISELAAGQFRTIIEDDFSKDGSAETVIFLSGKIVHEVTAALKKLGNPRAKVIRIEQLHPFPQFEFKKSIKDSAVRRYVWVQEEPENMGAWSYIRPYLENKLGLEVQYIGRPAGASTATGSPKRHAKEQTEIIDAVIKTIQS